MRGGRGSRRVKLLEGLYVMRLPLPPSLFDAGNWRPRAWLKGLMGSIARSGDFEVLATARRVEPCPGPSASRSSTTT